MTGHMNRVRKISLPLQCGSVLGQRKSKFHCSATMHLQCSECFGLVLRMKESRIIEKTVYGEKQSGDAGVPKKK